MRRLKPYYILAVFPLILACSTPEAADGNEVNVKVYILTDKATPVLLKLNGKNFVEEETRPLREVYRRVQTFADEENNVDIYYKEGERDTSFVYKGSDQKNYMVMMYSEWWDRFFVLPVDSASFYEGGNDVVEYD